LEPVLIFSRFDIKIPLIVFAQNYF